MFADQPAAASADDVQQPTKRQRRAPEPIVGSQETSKTVSSKTPLSYAEAFWLATVGGARSLGVRGLTGRLAPGSDFDAVLVDPEAPGSPIDIYDADSELDVFQKWLQLG
eukprot:SAG31_NODE_11539_length_1019_cov_1.263043_2_plen_109_part_01